MSDRKKNKRFKNLREFPGDFANVIMLLAAKLFWFAKFRYSGDKKAIKNHKGRAVIICNHVWWIDAPLMCAMFIRKRVHVVAAKEMFLPVLRPLLKGVRCIPLDRTIADVGCIRECVRLLREDSTIGIFPEGQFNHEDSGILPFKSGVALIAAQGDAPVIPMYVAGNFQLFGRAQIICGQPININKPDGPISAQYIDDTTNMLRDRMMELEGELEAKMSSRQMRKARLFRRRFAEKMKNSKGAK